MPHLLPQSYTSYDKSSKLSTENPTVKTIETHLPIELYPNNKRNERATESFCGSRARGGADGDTATVFTSARARLLLDAPPPPAGRSIWPPSLRATAATDAAAARPSQSPRGRDIQKARWRIRIGRLVGARARDDLDDFLPFFFSFRAGEMGSIRVG